MPVELIKATQAAASIVRQAAPKPAADAVGSFADALGDLVGSVDKRASEANTAVAGMIDKTADVHDAMIALQRAESTLQLTVQIRNKLVQAYQDVMRMPI